MTADCFVPRRFVLLFGILALLALSLATQATAANGALTLAVHPVLPEAETRRSYQPLANYLAEVTGRPVRLATSANFLVHWQMIRRGEYHLVLDGPHFTDYRIERLNYVPLVRIPDLVSYTLVANEELMILDARDLIGHTVATLPSPALGALRLHQLYTNPLRQPELTEANNAVEAAELVLAGRAAGAILPAALVSRYPGLMTVTVTEQVPAPALSASPAVDRDTAERIRQALLEAGDHPLGRRALEAMRLEGFIRAEPQDYAGQAKLLEGVWGY